MKTHIIEAVVGQSLWSSFLVGQFDTELEYLSEVDVGRRLLAIWDPGDILVLDLGTREGAVFARQGFTRADIERHQVHTSPLFESFLNWLREQFTSGVDFADLPHLVNLPATEATDSYRHGGPVEDFLKLCLASTDRQVVSKAKALWLATHGSLPGGVPPTLADFQRLTGTKP